MKQYYLEEHTADIRLRIQASTLPELFEGALEGMAFFMGLTNPPKNSSITKDIKLTAQDNTELLINFLSDVLTHSHIHKTIFYKLEIISYSLNNFHVRIHGIAQKRFAEDIKAITYHEANVQKDNNGIWETIVVFDI